MKKMCTKCKEIKDFSEFNPQKDKKYGLCCHCKTCKKLYYEENKEKISTKNKKYRKKHKEKIAIQEKQKYIKNRDKILIQKKQYYIRNKDRISIKSKRYHENNKEIMAAKNKLYRDNNKEELYIQKKQYRRVNRAIISKHAINYNKGLANYLTRYEKLTIDEAPRLAQDNVSLEVRCKYCGEYFVPTNIETMNRIQALKGHIPGEYSLYCSVNCKESCPIYGKIKYPNGFKKASSREVNPLVRQMCFERDNWICQICGASQKEAPLHCHHIEGYTQNPRLGNDVTNTITLCKICHKEVHKLPGCGYHELTCKT